MLSLIALAASSVQLLGGRAGVLVFDSKIALRPIQPGTMLRSTAIRGWGDDVILRDGTFRKCCVSDSLTHWKRLGWRLATVAEVDAMEWSVRALLDPWDVAEMEGGWAIAGAARNFNVARETDLEVGHRLLVRESGAWRA